jgi:hypothetical protein
LPHGTINDESAQALHLSEAGCVYRDQESVNNVPYDAALDGKRGGSIWHALDDYSTVCTPMDALPTHILGVLVEHAALCLPHVREFIQPRDHLWIIALQHGEKLQAKAVTQIRVLCIRTIGYPSNTFVIEIGED